MRLLVTNDDGIESPFLHALVRALLAEGHTLAIAAPKREQSWIGAAKSRHRAVTSEERDLGFGCPTWAIDGTPSDCVNIALAHVFPGKFAPEGVISGMNMGANATLGFVLASGTIGGAWEGALHGLPAMAVSQDLTHEAFEELKRGNDQPSPALAAMLPIAARQAAQLAGPALSATRPRSFIVHNLNLPYPARPDARVRRTVPAHAVVPGLFGPAQDDGTHRFVFTTGVDVSPADLVTDTAVLAAGDISHSILDYTRLGA